ncbi:hypothetical protein O0S10_02445 [Methanocorpusculum sp. MG]|uniref:Uncharacterized protein n=1 Tax=Methanocorpusculum petauri TaxID=3002863 RepID=A0ABT4IFD4_9EURY|nr:hypothetical protein [Methanocorpusculum petauri]MCZ0860089.1 hypothetical protein [Methanocorpusculum petauri]
MYLNKKKTILIVALLVVALLLLTICILFIPVEGGINVQPLSSPPGENAVIVTVTSDDLARHPSLKRALETSESIIITKNPVHLLQYGDRCISEAEAMTITDTFGFLYRENNASPVTSRYIKWNDTYYQVQGYRI